MKIGVNAMGLIGAMREDFKNTADRLKTAGLDQIEIMSDWGAKPETIAFFSQLTGASGWDPENAARRIDYLHTIGIDVPGSFAFDDIFLEQAQEAGAYFQKYGLSYIVFSFLHYEDLADVYRKIEFIKAAAHELKPYGIQICMHNHECDNELLTDRDGIEKHIMDIFLENLTADELLLEVDTGWLQYIDIDPAAYIDHYIDRIHILHLKDICADYKTVDRDDIHLALGEGIVDFRAIFDTVRAHERTDLTYIIDQDKSKGDFVEDIIKSIQYVKSLV